MANNQNFEALASGAFELKDSGNRQKFSTGAQRDIQKGKGRYDLLPFHALERLARVFEKGAEKYEPQNWRKGIPLSRFLDSGLRHACKGGQGWKDEDHFAQAVWNFMCLIETKFMVDQGLLPKELDDLCDFVNPIVDDIYSKDKTV